MSGDLRILTGEQIRSWPVVGGWSVAPDGFRVHLGPYAKIGPGAKIGPYAKIGADATPESLNEAALARYRAAGESHLFVKWVTTNRQSPRWGAASHIDYPVGAVVECADADPACVQCGKGLHVLTIGASPALLGLGIGDDELIPLLVRVRTEDILYAGGQWGSEKLRVRRLEVLS